MYFVLPKDIKYVIDLFLLNGIDNPIDALIFKLPFSLLSLTFTCVFCPFQLLAIFFPQLSDFRSFFLHLKYCIYPK